MIVQFYFAALISGALFCLSPAIARTVETEPLSPIPGLVELPSQSRSPLNQLTSPQIGTAESSTPSFTISHDISQLPPAVLQTHKELVNAAQNANWDDLHHIIAKQPKVPIVSFEEVEDPIAYLKEISGDEAGHEILAILLEVLKSGYVHVEAGSDNEIYIWPYFTRVPLDSLTPVQRVELFTLITAGDFEEMASFGAYNFFRIGISPDGGWQFFIAGD